jgi:hypothetical protein
VTDERSMEERMSDALGFEERWKLLKAQLQAGVDRFDKFFPNTKDTSIRIPRDQTQWVIDQMSLIEEMPYETVIRTVVQVDPLVGPNDIVEEEDDPAYDDQGNLRAGDS